MNIIEKLRIEPIDENWFEDIDHVLKDQIREVEDQRNKMLEALIDSCEIICNLCIRLNPQHKNCNSCDELDDLRKPIETATGKLWSEIKDLL